MLEYVCAKCGKYLTWVPEYQHWYCHICKSYAGENGVFGKPAPQIFSTDTCPVCSKKMDYIAQYQAWFCANCQTYKTMQGPTIDTPCPKCKRVGMIYSYEQQKWYCPTCREYPEESAVKKSTGVTHAKEEKKDSAVTVVDDLFLMYNDGRLIKHFTRRLKPLVDTDILSGMLMAVQDFEKDAFPSDDKEGNVEEIKLGELRIIVFKGKWTSLAAIISGSDPEGLNKQMSKCILEMEAQNETLLKDWSGDLVIAKQLQKYIMKLLSGEYAQ
jgi:hypothetical protein